MIDHNKASAETYAERYSKGMSAGYTDCSNNKEYYPDSPGLIAHTHVYQIGYDQGIYKCNHDIPEGTQSTLEAQPTTTYYQDNPQSQDQGCNAADQTCGYNSDGTSHPVSNNNNHVSQVDSTTVNPFPRHCDIGGWPSCYQTGYNAGFSDSNAGIGNGNCYGKYSDNFCSGYSNGWQAAHSKDDIKSTDNNGNINSNDQNQTSKQGQLSISNNINNQTFNPTNNEIFKPIINIINNPRSNSGSSSNTNSTSGSGSLSGSNSGSASSAGHNK